MASKPELFLDTKGLCFMCLEDTQQLGTCSRDPLAMDDDDDDNQQTADLCNSNIWSFQTLSHYLGIDLRKVFRVSVPLRTTGVLENSEIVVSLCQSCSEEAEKFARLHQQLQVIQMTINYSIVNLMKNMRKGQNEALLDEYRNRMMSINDYNTSLQSEIIENLRRETISKCLSRIKLSTPTVLVKKLNSDSDDLPVPEYSSTEDDSEDCEENKGDPAISPIDVKVDKDGPLFDFYANGKETSCSFVNFRDLSEEEEEESDDDEEDASNFKITIGPRGRKLFYCKRCEKFVTNMDLHLKEHDNRKEEAACPHCGRVFAYKSLIRNHVLGSHYEQSFMTLKEPDLPVTLFRAAVDLLLRRFYVSLDADTLNPLCEPQVTTNYKSNYRATFRCTICNIAYESKIIRNHIINAHYTRLSSELLTLQKTASKEMLTTYSSRFNRKQPYLNPFSRTDVENQLPVDERLQDPAKKTGVQTQEVLTTSISKSNSSTNINSKKIKYHCKTCNKRFRYPLVFKRHVELQHTRDSALKTEFRCDHCFKKFRFFFSYRIHLLNEHREKVFSSFAPIGTKPKIVKEVLNKIMKDYKELPDKTKICKYCDKGFKSLMEIQSHVIVSHYDEVVVEFQDNFATESDSDTEEETGREEPVEKDTTKNDKIAFLQDGISQNKSDDVVMKEENEQEDEAQETAESNVESFQIPVDPFSIY